MPMRAFVGATACLVRPPQRPSLPGEVTVANRFGWSIRLFICCWPDHEWLGLRDDNRNVSRFLKRSEFPHHSGHVVIAPSRAFL